MPQPPLPSFTGFVLAGGRSSRMGVDKATLDFQGRTLLANSAGILHAAGLEVGIAGLRAAVEPALQDACLSLRTPVLVDTLADAGPLGGIHAALSQSAARFNLFLPVDMPLLPHTLVALLIERALLTRAPVVACTLAGRLEPFPVVVDRGLLPDIHRRILAGSSSCYRAWRDIPASRSQSPHLISVENLLQSGGLVDSRSLPPIWWFQSANTPAELARLNSIAGRHPAFPPPTLPCTLEP